MSLQTCVDSIFDYYYKYGNQDYIGEEISQIEHMTQAAMLAENEHQNTYNFCLHGTKITSY